MSSKKSRGRARRARSEARRLQKRRARRATYAILLAGIVLLAGWLAVRPFLPRGGSGDESDVIVVDADMGGFHPGLIRARAGESTTIRLRSLDTPFHTDGGGKHQFAIDELGIDIIAPPRGSREVTFVAPEPGVYPFYCSICCGGKANPSMWGRLVVEA